MEKYENVPGAETKLRIYYLLISYSFQFQFLQKFLLKEMA